MVPFVPCYQNIKIQNLSFHWVVCVSLDLCLTFLKMNASIFLSLILVSAPRYDHMYVYMDVVSWGYIALVQCANVGSSSICNIYDVCLFLITWLYKEFVKRARKRFSVWHYPQPCPWPSALTFASLAIIYSFCCTLLGFSMELAKEIWSNWESLIHFHIAEDNFQILLLWNLKAY